MHTIIAGSRTVTEYNELIKAIRASDITPTVIISGTAQGADKLGERYGAEHNIPVERFSADWDMYGKRAGYIRNVEMTNAAEALICLWDGVSKGALHMINIAKERGLKIYVHRVDIKE